jgi:uncharacterized membrane protein YeaQ/YmgE (transglycosylase-associated protein family)
MGLIVGALAKLLTLGEDTCGKFVAILIGIAGAFVRDFVVARRRLGKEGTMKTFRLLFLSIMMVLVIARFTQAQSQWGDILKGAQKALEGGGGLSDSKIVDGLKEALHIGTGNAVQTVSKVGGYYNNPKIRIPLPGAVQKVEKLIRVAGYGSQVDAFELSMNQAAERAAPEAKNIFWDAIKQMSITDARKILDGPDNAATLYFKDKTYGRLSEVFKPIVHKSMSEVGVTEKYQELDQSMAKIPLVGSMRFDLDNYVDDKALDGLFFMLAQEEKKIRQDPTARVTDLLKEVFGKR